MIPRRFFWLFDTVTIGLAFLLANYLLPTIQPLLVSGGVLPEAWTTAMAAPDALHGTGPSLSNFTWMFVVMSIAAILFLELMDVYGRLLIEQSYRQLAGACLLACLMGLSLIALADFTVPALSSSRVLLFVFFVLSAAGLSVTRWILRWYYLRRRAAGYYVRNTALVGQTPVLEWLVRYFARHVPTTEYRLAGYLRIEPDQTPPMQDDGQPFPCLGDIQQLGDLLVHRPLHEVIFVQPASGAQWLPQAIQDCDYFRVSLRIVPGVLLSEDMRDLQVAYGDGLLHLPAVELAVPHKDSTHIFLKRLFDIVVSATLLVVLAPLFALIAIAIKVTTPRLPVFYRWNVIGQKGVSFTGYKFTTMAADADERKAEIQRQNEMSGPVFKMKDDPRVTPLGRILRKFSLNELPQLWSVLKGDMSLVGPRPAFRRELDGYEAWHKRKLSVRPGVTCLWQVSGRNEIRDFDEWVRLDLEYIDNWSLWLDFKILARTVLAVVRGTGS